jgi:ATP-binding cassette, subfamily B, bacterial
MKRIMAPSAGWWMPRLWLRGVLRPLGSTRLVTIFRQMIRRRAPVVLQMSVAECGPACLAMILGHLGRETGVSECREACGTQRDGLTALDLARTARAYGLEVKAFSLHSSAMASVALPAIAHWNGNHYVVVERWSARTVDVIDPAIGRRRLSHDEFGASFTGVILEFQPGPEWEQRSREKVVHPSYLLHILRMPGTVRALSQILAASLLLQLLALAVPAATKILVDQVLSLRTTSLMPMLGVGMAAVVVALTATTYVRGLLLIHLEARLDTRMMLGFVEHTLKLPFHFFQQRTTGDLLMRLSSNATIREALTGQAVSAVLDGSLVLVCLITLLAIQPLFGLVVLGIGLAQVALLLGTLGSFQRLMRRDLTASAETQSYLVEALTGIATLKASGAEEQALSHWSRLFFKRLDISLQLNRLSLFIQTVMMALRTFSPLLLLWLGAIYVLENRMSLGTMLAINALAASFLNPLASLVSGCRELQLIGAHLERIRDVLDAPPEQAIGPVREAPLLNGRIELQFVGFRYSPTAPAVLRNISVVIGAGQKVAIVGKSGSGKSTLLKILLGLHAPTEGEVFHDRLPFRELEYRSVRRQYGAVLQESFLFSGSIRRNIAFHDPDLPLERVMAAARLAGIHDEIAAMPMSYDTVLTEGGNGLSGGQRQRISLARAIAHHPSVLLLDEATSHLDALTEQTVDSNLARLPCTRVVIAHRLSTIRNADLILVMNDGEIVERGTHEELVALNGYYAHLIRSQMDAHSALASLSA